MKQTLFLHKRAIIGIDISYAYIKLMAIDVDKMRVTCYGSVNADAMKIRESLTGTSSYIADLIKELVSTGLVGQLHTDQVVISIPTNMTYSRSITLPKAAVKNLDDAIALETTQYIPVALSELNVSYEILSETKDSIDILMSAVPKRIVESVTNACEATGFTVLGIQPSINAVAQLIMLTEQGNLPTVIVDIGAADTDLAIFNNGIRANASIQVGGNSFTYAISEKLGVSLESAHQIKVLNGLSHGPKQLKVLDALQDTLKQIHTEIYKIIRYYNERLDASQKIEQVVITGSGSDMPGIGDYFTNELVMPARIAGPLTVLDFGDLPLPAKQFRPRYTTVTGLATLSADKVTL